jgi:hypothetical protein
VEARREKFTIAHELGHFVLRSELSSVLSPNEFLEFDPEEEALCDMFAAELLMPSPVICAEFKARGLSPTALRHVAREFDVSLQSVVVRANEVAGHGKFCASFWVQRSGVWEATWATPRRHIGAILCDTGATSVERAFQSDFEERGSLQLLADGHRERWSTASYRIPGQGAVLMIGLRPSARVHFGEEEPHPRVNAVVAREETAVEQLRLL